MTRYLRVSILGALPNGEKWSVNPHFICDPATDPISYTDLNTIATAISGITPAATMTGQWSTSTSLTGMRVEARDAAGALENVVEKIRTTPVVGSGSTPHPFQTAAVQTLKTATAGASGRGRLYWPATGAAIDASSLRWSSSACSSFLTGANAYLALILGGIRETAPATSLVVYSRSLNLLSLVNATAMGDVLDVQRRRRDALVENVVSAPFAN